jgi:hypothetical protein
MANGRWQMASVQSLMKSAQAAKAFMDNSTENSKEAKPG